MKTKAKSREQAATGLFLIAVFKLVKAALLVVVGVGAHHMLHKDLEQTIHHWVEVIRVDPDNYYIHRLLNKLFSVSPKQLKALSVGTFFYAALLGTEGVGLLMRKHWAEYFTVISTAALIPLELYELAKHFTAIKVLILIVNAAIVWYLVARLRSGRR